jgi:hypothetical protein
MRHATPARGVAASADSGQPTLLPTAGGETAVVSARAGGTVTVDGGNGSRSSGGTGSRVTAPDDAPRPATGANVRADATDASDDWSMLSRPEPTPPQRTRDPHTEPLGPFIPPAPISRPPQDQTRFVLGVVAALVVVGLIFAVFSLRGIFGAAEPLVQPGPLIPTPSPSATARGSAAADAPPSTAPSTAPSPAASVAAPSVSPGPTPSATPGEVSGIQAIDPQGDGDENGATADRAIDGDTSTTWRSARYNSANFGGLKKGLGLYLQLSGGPVKSVTVELDGRGGAVELRTADGPGLDSSVVVATAQTSDGKAVLTPTSPVLHGPLLLWFTELPQQSSGEYRLVVTEITVA